MLFWTRPSYQESSQWPEVKNWVLVPMTKSNVPRPGGDKTFRIMTMISIGSYKLWCIWMSTVTVWSMDTSPDLCKDILSTNGHPSMGFSPHKGLASCSGGKLSWGGIPLYLSRRSARYISCVVLWTLLPQVHNDVILTSGPLWCHAYLVQVWSWCPAGWEPSSEWELLAHHQLSCFKQLVW